jgi:hypothetical protein
MNLVRRVQTLEERALVVFAPPQPLALATPADVLAVLEEQVNAVRADMFAEPHERARTLGMLCSIALRCIEAKDLDARLEVVERVLKLRKQSQEEAAQAQKRRRY